eukprot:779516-Pyramimonas_sp.AAC.1
MGLARAPFGRASEPRAPPGPSATPLLRVVMRNCVSECGCPGRPRHRPALAPPRAALGLYVLRGPLDVVHPRLNFTSKYAAPVFCALTRASANCSSGPVRLA